MASSSYFPLAPFPCPHHLPNTCLYKALNITMLYQHLEIMLFTKRPRKSQLFWYIEIDDNAGNQNEDENENEHEHERETK